MIIFIFGMEMALREKICQMKHYLLYLIKHVHNNQIWNLNFWRIPEAIF